MKGIWPEADDFRASLGLPPLGEQREKSTLEKGTGAAVSSVMERAQHQLYAEMQAMERSRTQDERFSRCSAYYENKPERHLTEGDLMDEAIQWHIKNRKRCVAFGNMPSREGIHRYAICVPHATPGRSENNRRRNQARAKAEISIQNLGGRIFFVDEYPLDEHYMKIVYLYIIGYPTYFTHF